MLRKIRRNDPNYHVEEYDLDPPLTPIQEGFEKGRIYGVMIDMMDGEVQEVCYDQLLYRHPSKAVIEKHTNFGMSPKWKNFIHVKSPISLENAIEVAKWERFKGA